MRAATFPLPVLPGPVCMLGGQRNLLSSSTSHLPVHFQDRERQLQGEEGRTVSEQAVCWWRRREHVLLQKVKEGGEDLKGEGRGSHVMHSSSIAEPPTNANPQPALCANCAKSLRNSHWLPQEGGQQNRGSVTHFPWNSTYPHGPIDPFYPLLRTTKLNSATILDNNWRNYCSTVWEGKIWSAQLRNFDRVLALWFNTVLCTTFFFVILPTSHYFLEKSAPSQSRYAPVGKAILNRKQVFCWEKSSTDLWLCLFE